MHLPLRVVLHGSQQVANQPENESNGDINMTYIQHVLLVTGFFFLEVGMEGAKKF